MNINSKSTIPGGLGDSALSFMEKINYIRLAGTEGESKAAGAIFDGLASIGLNPRLEPFEIDGYEIKKAAFEITKPFACTYPVTGYGLSGSTAEGGLRAPFFYAEDGNDIALAQARGKIALLNAHVNANQYKKLVDAGVAGFVTISGSAVDEIEKTDLETRMLHTARHLKNGELPKIPGVTIRAADAIELLRAGEPEEAVLTLEQEEMKLASGNVIAEIEGADKAGEWITVGAHYDSVPFSPGMYDNAAGSAIIFEACRHFSQPRHKPRRSLRFIWFGAEERGLLGSLHHIAANPDEIKATKLMLNVDLAGQIIGSHGLMITAQKRVGDFLRFIAQEDGFGISIKQDIYSSDSTAYSDAGVPSFSFARFGTVGHCRNDIIKLCSAAAMEKSTAFMLHITERIANSEVFPIPADIPSDLKDKLDIYFNRKPPEDEQ